MNDILFVTPFYAPFVGGARAFLEATGRRMVADGYRVTVLTTTAQNTADLWRRPDPCSPQLSPRETLDGVNIERLSLGYPWPAPHSFGLLRRASHMVHHTVLPHAIQQRLLRFVARWMPPVPEREEALRRLVPEADLVQAVDSSWDGLFTFAASSAHRYRKPFAAMPLMHTGDDKVGSRFQMAHQVDVYRAADAVLALSQREATALGDLGVPAERIHTIPMGVDPEWQSQTGGLRAFRRDNRLTDPLVAFVGAQTYDKGAFTLAQAMARLNRDNLPVQLACAGPQSEQLRAFIKDQPQGVRTILGHQVRLLGTVSERTKHQLLAACDVLALPSRVDSFGIVLVEAGLHGKPVIGANAGGIPEVVEDGVTGLLVPFGDVSALADAIRKLVTKPALATQLGDAGRQRVLSKYTWDKTYRSMAEIYASLCRHQEE